ncbi:HAD family hydrolase [Flavobacterium sp. '19STA2R22 D10 B1']|uniref:HAD family hydrolase n=1 Tax=Flavobacterium aerium TaxID=3037261 RepID=UPI00278C497C|nr:HAD family phosphatase [Flavobacterium sp. '19STA2R22 D10 B1']
MINTIIFDFGNIFINIDAEISLRALQKLGLPAWSNELDELNHRFEKGKMNSEQFLIALQKHIPDASIDTIKSAWNQCVLEFPLARLEFLQKIASQYRLFLLTNTDSIHIEAFENQVGPSFYSDFYQCFEKVYYSFEIRARKPEPEAFNFIIQKHELSPKRTLFVDDTKKNTDVAQSLGLHVWNLNPATDDVTELFEKKIIII